MKAFFNRINQICYYLLLLSSFIFFIAVGLFFIFLSFSNFLKEFFISSILDNPFLLIFIGLLFLSIATVFLFKLSSSSSRSVYVYKLGNGSVGVHKNVINQYVDSYLRNLFKEDSIESHVVLKKNNILISISLPRISDSEQLPLTKKIQNDIDQILKNILGESYRCVLRLKFNKE